MTEPVAEAPKKSILATLLSDLEAIEQNFHGLADPQLAIAGKTRELLNEAVAVIEGVRAGAAKAEALAATVEDLLKRVAALEAPKAPVEAPPAQPKDAGASSAKPENA
jgi:hypothetical protein